MSPLKKILSLSLGLVVLGTLLIVINTGTGSAQNVHLNGGAAASTIPAIPVTVANTPLPVSISGTPTVNANIGTPNVNINGTPTVNANINGTPNVNVTSTKTTPVFVDIDNPARAGIGAQCVASFDASGVAQCTLATVPQGQTLVIETITCTASVATGSQIPPIVFGMGSPAIGGGGPISLNHRLVLTKTDSIGGLDDYGLATPVKMYAAAGTDVFWSVQVGSSTANQGAANCGISGYLATL